MLQVGAQEGILLSLVTLSVAVSFRILNFPDLTVDGSVPLGAVTTAVLISGGVEPWIATGCAFLVGSMAGFVTGTLCARFRIAPILSGILVMTMLYSINLRILGGGANRPLLNAITIFTPFEKQGCLLFLLLVVVAVKVALDLFFATNLGLILRATGDNPSAIRPVGLDPGTIQTIGLALANGLASLGGAIMAQKWGFADVTMGIGMIVTGFASLLLGETIRRPSSVFQLTAGAIVGSVIYANAKQFALSLGLQPGDVKIATALLVVLVLIPRVSRRRAAPDANPQRSQQGL